MNPIDLPGPQFLVLYAVVGAVILFLVRNLSKKEESEGPVPRLALTDPYEIAFLRGGRNEAMCVAAVSLIDRGLLEVSGENLQVKKKASPDNARRPIERALMLKFARPAEAHEIFKDNRAIGACEEYQMDLASRSLLANDRILAARRPKLFFGLIILIGLAATKIVFAYSRGHSNIGFLFLLAGLFAFLLFWIHGAKRTGMGDRVLEDLKELFSGLRFRAGDLPRGGETNEVALLAAIYGISALPLDKYSYTKLLFPKREKSDPIFGNSSCGSGCGSSSSCGGGGGCGGGGCGGCGS
jgi:uncharacterized protein (TIGR04222 family)